MGNQTAGEFFWFYFSMKEAGGNVHSSQGKSRPPALSDSPDVNMLLFAGLVLLGNFLSGFLSFSPY